MKPVLCITIGLIAAQTSVGEDRYSAQQRAIEAGERSRELSRQSQQRAMEAGERSRELSRQSQQRAMEAGERMRQQSYGSLPYSQVYGQFNYPQSFTVAAQPNPGRSRFIIIDGQRYEEIDGPSHSDGEELPGGDRPEATAIQRGPREIILQDPGLITVTLPHKKAQLYVNGALIPGEGEKRRVRFSYVKKGETIKAAIKVVVEADGKRITGEAEVDVPYGKPKEYRLNLDKARVDDLFLMHLKAERMAEEKNISEWVVTGQKGLAAKKSQLTQNREAAEKLLASREEIQKDELLHSRLLANIHQEAARKLAQLIAAESDYETAVKASRDLVPSMEKTEMAEYSKKGLAAVDSLKQDIQKARSEGQRLRATVDSKQAAVKVEAIFPIAEFIQNEVKVRAYELGTMGKWRADEQRAVGDWAAMTKSNVALLARAIEDWTTSSRLVANAIADEVLKTRVRASLERENLARHSEIKPVVAALEAEEDRRKMRIEDTFTAFVNAYRAGEDMNEVQKRYVASQPEESERIKLASEEILGRVDAATRRHRDGMSIDDLVGSETKFRTYEISLGNEITKDGAAANKWLSERSKGRSNDLLNWRSTETSNLASIKFALVKSAVEGVYLEESKVRSAFEQERAKKLEAERDRRTKFTASFYDKMLKEFRATGTDLKSRTEMADATKGEVARQQSFNDSLRQRDEAELKRIGNYLGVAALEKLEKAIYPIPHRLVEGCGAYSLVLELTGSFTIYHEKTKGKRTKVAEFATGELQDAACDGDALAILASKITLTGDQPAKEYRGGLWFAIFHQAVIALAAEPELKHAKFERVWFESKTKKFFVTAVEDKERFTMAVSIDGKELDQIDNREAPARTKDFMGRLSP